MDYKVQLDVFEGPLDLLLHLIKEQKLDIYDIPISDITKQYLAYINLMKELNLSVAGDYLVMAAELARIKSKMLLPQQEQEDEEESGEDPREKLVRKLLEYKKYKEAAGKLRVMEFHQNKVFTRNVSAQLEEGDDDVKYDVTVFDLMIAFKHVMKELSFRDDYDISVDEISVTDKINYIMEKLSTVASITFDDLLRSFKSKLEVIATFLGLLELMKLNMVKIQQIKQFGPIRIFKAPEEDVNGRD
ncbi:MAG: segregation/condensation protein A [Nitrospinota bacterium]|nr:segregation/condensation protein A [Nitrospinota bacterium]MDP7580905.1 segregation/condensation protein A [Nitrospinota bacterium]HJN02572.1 segregation/condensation protein A [Nitrospinota bacterium]